MEVQFNADELRPLIEEVIEQVIQRREAQDAKFGAMGERMAFSEAEAAALLGFAGKPHVLRDCRLRGEISAKKVGKQYRYAYEDLQRFLRDDQRKN